MNENRKWSLCLISTLAIIITTLTFLYRQSSLFWISSQLMLLTGTVLFLGMCLFVTDAREFKMFALPVGVITIGELLGVFTQFRFLFDQTGIKMEPLSFSQQPIELLAAIACVIELIALAWTVIDVSTDFSFCDMTCLILGISCGFAATVDMVLLVFSLGEGMNMIRMQSVFCLSDLFSFGTVVVFYFGYTKERRAMFRYYKACANEKKKAELQMEEEAKALREEKELMELERQEKEM